MATTYRDRALSATTEVTHNHNPNSSRKRAQQLAADLLQYHHNVISRMEQSLSALKRKLDRGRTSEVIEELRSRSLITEHHADFDKAFDNIIFQLWPDFIERINHLFHPDRRIEDINSKSLPAEVRVVAFTALGIENTSVISTLLGLSPNTIYTYRHRSRSRALNRNSFDSDLKSIL